MGIKKLVASYTTTYGGEANRLHNVRLVAQLVDRHLIPPGAEFSFNRTTGERTAEKGFLRGAGDHQRRAPDGPRRRCLPGLDDRVQRRLRGRAPDHRPHEPLALHQPLPDRPRRDGQLPGPRPALRQRHRQVAAPADVRRLVVAHGGALRDAGEPAVEVGDRAASRHRGADRSKRVPGPERLVGETSLEYYGEPARATSVRRRVYSPSGKLLSRHDVVVVLRRRAADRPRRPKPKPKPKPPPPPKEPPPPTTTGRRAAASSDHHARSRRRRLHRPPGRPELASAAAAIASTRKAGTRVGLSVFESTQAWRVQPSATRVPSRSHGVLEAEARAAHVEAARADLEPVREARRHAVADVRLDGRRVDARLQQRGVAALGSARGSRSGRSRTRRDRPRGGRRPVRRSRRTAPSPRS